MSKTSRRFRKLHQGLSPVSVWILYRLSIGDTLLIRPMWANSYYLDMDKGNKQKLISKDLIRNLITNCWIVPDQEQNKHLLTPKALRLVQSKLKRVGIKAELV